MCDFLFFQLPGRVPVRPLGVLLRLLLPPAVPVPRALRLPARTHRADRLGLHHARRHHRALHRHLLAAQVRRAKETPWLDTQLSGYCYFRKTYTGHFGYIDTVNSLLLTLTLL